MKLRILGHGRPSIYRCWKPTTTAAVVVVVGESVLFSNEPPASSFLTTEMGSALDKAHAVHFLKRFIYIQNRIV